MIRNKPNPIDFERQSIEYLVQFFDLIYQKEQPWMSFGDDEPKEYIWEYHQGTLKSALTLLFLALENQLKSKICTISPLLLLSDNPSDWKTIRRDKDFHDFHIRPFDDLLTLFLELEIGEINETVIQNLNKLRQKRNKIVHAVYTQELSPKSLLMDFALIIENIWGVKIWWEQYKKYTINDPDYGSYDENVEHSWLSHEIQYLIDTLGKNITGRILDVDYSQRRYLCPECHVHVNENADNYFYKHSVLKPNNPLSEHVYCVVCDKEFEVVREDCWDKECKGNVIHFLTNSQYADGEICLTCGSWKPEHLD